MGRLRSGRVKRTPLTGVTSDRYKFLGLEQAEPTFGDPLVGPSSVGLNPIPVGQVYQVVSVSNSEGKRYWTPLVGFGTTVGVISVYENGFLPGGDNKFQTIHGLNFVGSGVTIETPPVDGPFEGVGIATIRIAINELKNQGNVNEILYNTSSGLASGADDFVYNELNTYVGIGTTLPSEKLEVVGNIKVSGNVKSPEFIGNLTGTATTSINVIGGIGSITQLRVTGVSTLGIITSGNIYSTGVVTATTFFGNLIGTATTATNLGVGNTGEIPYQVNSGITSFISVSGASNKFLKYDGSKPIWSDLTGQIASVDVKNNSVDKGQYLLFSASIGATSELNVNSNKLIFNPNTSRLGIGTTNPTTTLHVQGSIGFGVGDNIKLGDSETGKSITSGTDNFFAGKLAGRDLTTGSNNVFIGYAAGFQSQSGSDNNIIGNTAGAVNRGNNNFFVGTQAGLANTTGSNNTFIGSLSGGSNTIGCMNNFIGCLSGFNNTTGSYNNFFGPNAGFCNVSGGNNNFFGVGAGRGNISGFNNNFLGNGTGGNNATGSYNNFFGSYSGNYNTVGNQNNFFGNASGHCNTTGSCNIFIGRCAGYANISGSGNIVIGYNRETPVLNGSNQLAIGAGTEDWIVGNSNFNVGIGTTNPTSKLHVNGNLLITGVSTLGTVRISSGIITATSGIVTYYGDGSNLTKLPEPTQIKIYDDSETDALRYISFASTTVNSGLSSVYVDSGLSYNPFTNTLNVKNLNLTGSLQKSTIVYIYVDPINGNNITDLAQINVNPPISSSNPIKTLTAAVNYVNTSYTSTDTIEYRIGPGIYLEKGIINFKTITRIRAWDYVNNNYLNDNMDGGTVAFATTNFYDSSKQPTFVTEVYPDIFRSPQIFLCRVNPLTFLFEQEAEVCGVVWWGSMTTISATESLTGIGSTVPVVADSFFPSSSTSIGATSTNSNNWRYSAIRDKDNALNYFIRDHSMLTTPINGTFYGFRQRHCMEFRSVSRIDNVGFGAFCPANSSILGDYGNNNGLLKISTSNLITLSGIRLVGNVKVSSEVNVGIATTIRLRAGDQEVGEYSISDYFLTGHSPYMFYSKSSSGIISLAFAPYDKYTEGTPGTWTINRNTPYNNIELLNSNSNIGIATTYQSPSTTNWKDQGPAFESLFDLFGEYLDPNPVNNWSQYFVKTSDGNKPQVGINSITGSPGFIGKFGNYHLVINNAANRQTAGIDLGITTTGIGVKLGGFGADTRDTLFRVAGSGTTPTIDTSGLSVGGIGTYVSFTDLNVRVRSIKKGIDVNNSMNVRMDIIV